MNQCILDIVNSYMQMYTKLNYYYLTQTIPVCNTRATYSQCWHRDPEEPRMCKMFIYLSDVDETAGPFIYIPYTVRGQKWSHLFPQKPPSGNYPPEESVKKLPQHETRLTITGTAGIVIFCDTTGLHRGGYATVKDRVMFTAFYTSPRWSEPQRYKRSDTSGRYLKDLSPQARYALEH
jgi:ectoine hydroxylase-related dioxygenase (phytanoyl-CoA dioxygenase family)